MGPEGSGACDGVEPLQVREADTSFVVIAANYGPYICAYPVGDGVGVGAIVDEVAAAERLVVHAVGMGEERAVVRDGKIVAAHIMSVTLACDHRSIDGALGAVLVSAFKALIENPVMMLV